MSDVLNPVRELKLGNETIEVRELSWPDALEFFKRLAVAMGRLIDGEGNVTISADTLAETVTQNGDLIDFLVTKATGRDSGWLAGRSFGEVMELVDAAISVNLSEEIMSRGKRLAGRVQAAFGQKKSAQ